MRKTSMPAVGILVFGVILLAGGVVFGQINDIGPQANMTAAVTDTGNMAITATETVQTPVETPTVIDTTTPAETPIVVETTTIAPTKSPGFESVISIIALISISIILLRRKR